MAHLTALSDHVERPACVVDAGCGEGFYAEYLCKRLRDSQVKSQIMAFDISADAIKIAAGSHSPIKWMVADITNIPIREGAVDCILDIFTPANYGEFHRILADDGIVIKTIAGNGHLKQLRQAAPHLRNKKYDNGEVLRYFLEHFQLIERKKVSHTMAIDEKSLEDLIYMTPLLFDVDKSRLDLRSIAEITVEAEILVGEKNR